MSTKICENCKKEKQIPNEIYFSAVLCNDCKKSESKTTCKRCNETFKRKENFNFRKLICDKCSKKIEEEEIYRKTYRKCDDCEQEKLIGKEISYKGTFCFACDEKRKKAQNRAYFEKHRKFSWERKCSCGTKVITTNPKITIIKCDKCKGKA